MAKKDMIALEQDIGIYSPPVSKFLIAGPFSHKFIWDLDVLNTDYVVNPFLV